MLDDRELGDCLYNLQIGHAFGKDSASQLSFVCGHTPIHERRRLASERYQASTTMPREGSRLYLCPRWDRRHRSSRIRFIQCDTVNSLVACRAASCRLALAAYNDAMLSHYCSTARRYGDLAE
jgi:hypothetical protein